MGSLRLRPLAVVAPLVAALASCGNGASRPPPLAPARRPTQEPVVSPPVSDAPASSSVSPEPVELLHAVPSQVVVSSLAGASLHTAELVDGSLETAWNSAQDDVTRSWIAFRVPPDARVTSVQMTAGFVRVDGARDFFTGNHRVRKVRVSRDGEPLGEHAIDPENRGLQTIPVSGQGGEYRIDFVELVPGTSQRWRQTCVSELRVLGFAGAERHESPAPPIVRVGSFAGVPAPDGRVPPRVSAKAMTLEKRPAIDRHELARTLQGSWLTPVRPRAWTMLRGDGGDRVALIFATHSSQTEERAQRRRIRRGVGRLPAGSDDCPAGSCPEVYAARVSIPGRGIPQVDRIERVGVDMCGTNAYEELATGDSDPGANFVGRIDLEDLDGDGGLEARFLIRWQTTPVCPVGWDEYRRQMILDLETSQLELDTTLYHHPQSPYQPRSDSRLVARDVDGDGDPDFEMTTTDFVPCVGLEPGPHCGYHTERGTFLYDPATDRWVGAEEPRPSGP